MRLGVRSKTEIVATIKLGKKDKEIVIQKLGPYMTYFRLSEVRSFTQDDIKFIMKDLPEYAAMMTGVKNYMNNLESSKGTLLSKLKEKYNSIADATVMDMKLSVNQKFKVFLDYEGNVKSVYTTDIEDYDPFNNNVLE
jgi:hypothetical protein